MNRVCEVDNLTIDLGNIRAINLWCEHSYGEHTYAIYVQGFSDPIKVGESKARYISELWKQFLKETGG